MGKNRTIKTIAQLIAGMTAHKLLEKYPTDKRSIPHLKSEVQNYHGKTDDFLTEYNWNEYDKEKIKKEAEKDLNKEVKKPHFKGITYPASEKDRLLKETIKEFFE